MAVGDESAGPPSSADEQAPPRGPASVSFADVTPLERVPEAAPVEQPSLLDQAIAARLVAASSARQPGELEATLRKLGLVGCCTGQRAALQRLTSVRVLDWRDRRLSPADGRTLAHLLQHVCGSLTKLYINRNCLGDEGARALGSALTTCRNVSLTTLLLSSNKIGDDGATSLAQALAVNTSLTALWLSNNMIGDQGAKAVAAGLSINGSLTTLWLHENKIGDEGAKALGSALAVNTSLKRISLYAMYVVGGAATDLGHAAKTSLRYAVRDREGFDLQL